MPEIQNFPLYSDVLTVIEWITIKQTILSLKGWILKTDPPTLYLVPPVGSFYLTRK